MFSVPEQTLGKHSGPSASTGDWLHDSYRQQNSQHSGRSRETPQHTQPATSRLGILGVNQLHIRLVEPADEEPVDMEDQFYKRSVERQSGEELQIQERTPHGHSMKQHAISSYTPTGPKN